MARLSRKTRSENTFGPARALPWLMLGQAAVVLRDHWGRVSPEDRSRLAQLLKASKGRPMNLTPRQRDELTGILKRLDVMGLSRDVAPIVARRAAGRRGPLRRG